METGPSKKGPKLIVEFHLLVMLFLTEYIPSNPIDLIFPNGNRKIVALPSKLESRQL